MQYAPYRVSYGFARGIVQAMRVASPRYDGVALKNLSIAFPNKSEDWRRKVMHGSYNTFARNLTSFARAGNLVKGNLEKHFPDFPALVEVIDNARANGNGKGVLIAGLHYGSPEFNIQGHALLSQPTAMLARGFNLPLVDSYIKKRREMFGNVLFDRAGAFKHIERHINQGKDVALLFDQNIRGGHACFPSFFGVPAATTKSVGLAALRTGAPIVFVCGAELEPEVHSVIAYEVSNPINEEGTIEEKILRLMEQLHRHAEDAIREYPDQWMWFHRRYKTRPSGEVEDFYE